MTGQVAYKTTPVTRTTHTVCSKLEMRVASRQDFPCLPVSQLSPSHEAVPEPSFLSATCPRRYELPTPPMAPVIMRSMLLDS